MLSRTWNLSFSTQEISATQEGALGSAVFSFVLQFILIAEGRPAAPKESDRARHERRSGGRKRGAQPRTNGGAHAARGHDTQANKTPAAATGSLKPGSRKGEAGAGRQKRMEINLVTLAKIFRWRPEASEENFRMCPPVGAGALFSLNKNCAKRTVRAGRRERFWISEGPKLVGECVSGQI